MKNETKITHRRYFVYRHKMMGENQVMEYLNGDDWVMNFAAAYLWADKETALWMAKNRRKYFHPDSGFTVCIGAVDCNVAGQFVPEVVHA